MANVMDVPTVDVTAFAKLS